MSETLTQIADQALISIGKDAIKSLDDIPANPNASSPTQKSGAVVRVVLDQAIRLVQSKARWSDLQTAVTLSLLYAPTDTEPCYIYNYPTDVLGFTTLASSAPFQIRSGKLYTGDPAAVLEYIRYSREPSEWNSFLTDAVVTEVAARIAIKLADPATAQAARQIADRTLIDSAASDYTNRSTPRTSDSFYSLNQARCGWSGRYSGSGQISRLRSNGGR